MRLEGKSRFAPTFATLACLTAMAVLLPLDRAIAQDSGTSEPAPTLRGFRLDPAPEKTAPPPPTPTMAPQGGTPKSTSTASPKPSVQTRPAQPPRTKAAEPKTPPVSNAEPTASTSPESVGEQPPVTEPVVPERSQAVPETNTTEPRGIEEGGSSLWWQLSALLAALGIVLAGIGWLRRQTRTGAAADEIVGRPAAPAPVAGPPPSPPAKPAPAPTTAPASKPVVQRIVAEAPVILEFIPDRAVVSLNNLSVTGKLRLTNRTDKPVEQLRLRATLIGASADQAEIISAFHNQDDGNEKSLADLKPGEKRAFAIDMALPLADMPSYLVGSQRLLVPIVVANLAYGKGRNSAVELACIIGREANPPQPKLGALRLDLGPRSFSPLGQRQLAA